MRFVLMFLTAALCNNVLLAQAPPVSVKDTGLTLVIDNGLIAVTMAKKDNPQGRNGEGISIQYKADGKVTELSNGRRALYFDVGGDRIYPVEYADGKIVRNDPDLAEVAWIADPHSYTPAVRGGAPAAGRRPGASTAPATRQAPAGAPQVFPFHTEFHLVMKRGETGFYLYAIYQHDQSMPAGSVGETRFVLFGARSNSIFTNHIVDDQRMGPFTLSPVVRTLQDVTTLRQDGSVYTKYNNSAYNFDHHVHGMAGHGLGMWMIIPSNEAIGGGPFKQELTVHAENALLAMMVGGHFGTQGLSFRQGELWNKVYGPVFVYCNHTDSQGDEGIQALWNDAKKQANAQIAQWPYTWLKNADYPLERGVARGRLAMSDGTRAAGAWAILSPANENWTQVLKGYDYWAQVDADGNYVIANIRPGAYKLSFVGANQFASREREGITIHAGDNTVSETTWTPEKHGRQLWQIGTADRLTMEYRDGDQRQFEGFATYLKDFPQDVNFIVGKSREKQDWYYAQFAVYNQKPYWTIQFDSAAALAGKATLTVGFASQDPHNTGADNTAVSAPADLHITLNGKELSSLRLRKTGTAGYRSGTSDSNYVVEHIAFDAALITTGANEIHLGFANPLQHPADPLAMPVPSSVMYDAIRLEVDDAR